MESLIATIKSENVRELFRFLSSESIGKKIEAFLDEHCESFDPDLGSLEHAEHKLEHGALHQQYCDLVSGLLESFTKEHDIGERALYDEVKSCVGNDPTADALLETFLATFDFRFFVGIMCSKAGNARAMKALRAEAKEGGCPGDDAK